MNPLRLILNSGMTCALITLFALQSHADERIVFDQVSHEATYAKVSCRSTREVSKSLSTKYGHHYRAYLTPRQIKMLIKQRQFMVLDGLVSVARVKAYGRQALAKIKMTDIAVTVKTLNNKTISTSLFRWSDEDQSFLETASRRYHHFNFYDQGSADCKAKSSRNSTKTCYFGTHLNTRNEMDRLSALLAKHYAVNPNEDLVVDVFYRHLVHVDCSGTRSQALARSGNAKPELYLRDVD